MAKVKTISTEQLQRRLEQGNSLHFWNVLTDGYFKGEMVILGTQPLKLPGVNSALPRSLLIHTYLQIGDGRWTQIVETVSNGLRGLR